MSSVSDKFHPDVGPVIEVGFAHPGAAMQAVRGSKPEIHYYTALIDTGAFSTSITKNVADQMDLKIHGKRTMVSAHGPKDSNTYYADIFIPVMNVWNPNLEIVEFHAGLTAFDVLLGRDILCKGLLTVDGPKREFTFSVKRGTPAGRA